MNKIISLFCVLSLVLIAFVGCAANEPEYMHPYGEGVDPNSVTTVPFQTRTTTTVTTSSTTVSTKATLTTVPHGAMHVDVPEGCVLCPLCQGVLVVCESCLGTLKVKVEVQDASTGVFVRKYADCPDCLKTPGYTLCELCENKLYVKE